VVGFGDEVSELAQHSRCRADDQPIGAVGESGVFGAFAEIYRIDKLRELDGRPVTLLNSRPSTSTTEPRGPALA